MRVRIAVSVVLIAVCGLILSACGTPAAERGVGSYTTPGLRDLPGKNSRAVGTLVRVELEGGFWAVKDALPEKVSAETPNVVVVANPGDVHDIATFEGQYVAVVGEVLEGVSTRQAGPEMRVVSIEPAPESTP